MVSASSMRILARSSLLSIRLSVSAAVTVPESVSVPGRTGVRLTAAVRRSPGASVPSAQPVGRLRAAAAWLTRAVVPRALPPATPVRLTFVAVAWLTFVTSIVQRVASPTRCVPVGAITRSARSVCGAHPASVRGRPAAVRP